MKKRTLIIGASSDLATDIIPHLIREEGQVGLHYAHNKNALLPYEMKTNVRLIQRCIESELDCKQIIDEYITWADGLDNLIILMGDVNHYCHWSELSCEDIIKDYSVNTVFPFLLVKYAYPHMVQNGGRIILVSTASAQHGGGSYTLAYGMAKSALECLTKGLAKDLATYNILVNAVAAGFIDTKFHTERCHKTLEDLEKRIDFVPLKRAGTKEEFGSLVCWMLTKEAGFVTGQVITIDGGDFI